MSHPRLDVTIPARRGLRIRLVGRPGAWMSDSALEALVRDLHAVADASTPGGGTLRYGLLSGSRERLASAILSIAYDSRTGTAIGFNATTLLSEPIGGRTRQILHVGLCMVRPEQRSKGLCFALTAAAPLVALALNGLRPLWLTNVTQVPAAAGIFAAMAPQTYPAPGHTAAPSREHADVASALMARHRAVFGVGEDAVWDAERFVIRNAYTGGSDDLKKSFAACAQHRDPEVNRMCSERLDYARGDDLLQVGRLTLAGAATLLGRFVRDVVRGPLPLAALLRASRAAAPGWLPRVPSVAPARAR
jgi:hypothetical protein